MNSCHKYRGLWIEGILGPAHYRLLSLLHRASTSALGKTFKGGKSNIAQGSGLSSKSTVGGEQWSQRRPAWKLDYCHYPDHPHP